MKRITGLTLAAVLLELAACGKSTPKKQAQPPVSISDTNPQASQDALKKALNERPKQGGVLSVQPIQVLFDVPQGGRAAQQQVNLVNEGDDALTIKSVTPAGSNKDLSLSGSCTRDGLVLQPAQTCEILVNYQDTTGNNFNTNVLVATSSPRSPFVRFDISANVQAPDVAPPGVQRTRRRNTRAEQAFAQSLMAAQEERQSHQSDDFGQASVGPNADMQLGIPSVETRDSDPRYDPDRIPWTETSLKVNRHNILTADRIIPAVMESPVSALMCNQVTAVVDQNVYSPDGVNVLIPAGTRALGHCGKFTDERLNIQWFRLITPDGVNIAFNQEQADTADAMGRGGAIGQVQQRTFDRYVAPVLESGVDVLSAVARAAFGSNQTTSYNSLSGQQTNSESRYDAAIDDFNNRGRQTLENSIQGMLDQRRNVVVAPGTRIEIMPQEDIYFKTPSQVIRLADYEYEIRQDNHRPLAVEQPAPTLALTPQLNGQGSSNTLFVDGRTYAIQPAQQNAPARGAAAGVGSNGMRSGISAQEDKNGNNSGFFGTPKYYNNNSIPGRGGVSSTYGGIESLNNTLSSGYSGAYGSNGSGNTVSQAAQDTAGQVP